MFFIQARASQWLDQKARFLLYVLLLLFKKANFLPTDEERGRMSDQPPGQGPCVTSSCPGPTMSTPALLRLTLFCHPRLRGQETAAPSSLHHNQQSREGHFGGHLCFFKKHFSQRVNFEAVLPTDTRATSFDHSDITSSCTSCVRESLIQNWEVFPKERETLDSVNSVTVCCGTF